MNLRKSSRNSLALLLLLLTAVVLVGAGCISDDPANESLKPWNSPEGWQNGNVPAYMTQPH